MAVPTVQEYSTLLWKVPANTAAYDELEVAGTSGCTVKIYDSSDTLLSTVPLSNPPGSVNGTTGQITLTPSGPDTSAAATGTAAYGEVHDAGGTWWTRMPCEAGSSPVSGKIVLTSLSIVATATVTLSSITIGP
jgi:hypothetical protein